jgi:hypothetical protein
MRRIWFCLPLMLCFACASGTEARRVGKAVDGQPRGPEPATIASDNDGALGVDVPTIRVEGGRVKVELVARNLSGSPLELILSPVGGNLLPGAQTPLHLSFASGEPVRHLGQQFPPAAPPPMQMVIPPDQWVVFRAEMNLSHWTWDGEPEVEVEWRLALYRRASPTGSLRVRLPRR